MELMSEKFAKIDQNEPVSQLIGKLEGGTACIMDQERFLGIFDPTALLKVRMDVAELKSSHVVKAVPKLSSKDDARTITRHFIASGVHMLPVMEKEKLLGVVYDTALLQQIKAQVGNLRVADLKHPRPIVMREDDRIDKVLITMREDGIDHIPVVGADEKVIGMVSITDVLKNYSIHHIERDHGQAPKSRTRAFKAESPDLAALPVSNVMQHGDVETIDEQEQVSAAIDRMLKKQVRSLVIVDDGVPTGMIMTRDIFESFVQEPVDEHPNIQFVGLEELRIGSALKSQVRNIAFSNTKRLEHYFATEYQLTLHIKEYAKTGQRHKFSVHLRATFPGASIPVTQSDSWNIRSAAQDAFNRLEQQLSHMTKENKKEAVSERKTGRAMPGEAL